MTTDRLDRVEDILANLATAQAQAHAAQAESNAASSARMDRLEANLARTEKIVESNARAIEAWSSRIEEGIAEAEEVSSATAANTREKLESAITDTVAMISTLGEQQQAATTRSDQLHAETGQRFEVFLQDARADRQRFDRQMAELQASRQQADKDRVLNESEHRAFRETFQTMLGEIARLWRRVEAG